jgi:hypothetical protein
VLVGPDWQAKRQHETAWPIRKSGKQQVLAQESEEFAYFIIFFFGGA